MITSNELRARFLAFFERKGHTVVPSSSLVPAKDPTLLFSNSGMVQFKDVFTGAETKPYTRATTAQKCVRAGGKHNDLENVGPSPSHHTFFEMLGNFSFGDYFKREAITYAWEFLIDDLGMDPSCLWPTIHYTDDEAFALWREIVGLPEERITRLGDEDNFWRMADVGPCGPDSEIFFDRGAEHGCGEPGCNPSHECGRWWEIWNLVFMQYFEDERGVRTPLPQPNIDTGMGFERMVAVLQGADSNYETDLFLPLMDRVQQLAGHSDEERSQEYIAYRVIADHSRTAAFLIADGVLPGNEGRSYVLRRIIRRAIRFARRLGLERPFLADTTGAVVENMGRHYSEVTEKAELIRESVAREEEQFTRTLSRGVAELDALIDRLTAAGQRQIPGDEAFRLYDTHGFPLDLTVELAADRQLEVDREGFARELGLQRERSRGASTFNVGATLSARATLSVAGNVVAYISDDLTRFTGYDLLEDGGRILAILGEPDFNTPIQAVSAGDQQSLIFVDRTPFYSESGGQVGDTGIITGPEGDFEVLDTQRYRSDLVAHRGRVLRGTIRVGEDVDLSVSRDRRRDIMRNHTSTHLLHKALRDTLGPHAQQRGSLVAPDRLRFDFAQPSAIAQEELWEIERVINDRTQDDRAVTTAEKQYAEAVAGGAMALFGEKYGDLVRVVSIDGYGQELCGGTHVHHTGEIGPVYITSEGSIGSGIRRVEAVSGREATAYARERLLALERAGAALRVPALEVERQVASLQERVREQERQLAQLRRQLAGGEVDALLSRALAVDGTQVLVARTEVADRQGLAELADRLRDRLGSGVVVLGAVQEQKPSLLAVATPDVVARGAHAGNLVRAVAPLMDGSGGGRPDRAQGGGRSAEKLDDALGGVADVVARQLAGA